MLLLFLVENCLKTLLLVHLHFCFDGKTPDGFRQTKCFEGVDSVLLNWGPIKRSLVLQCQGCAEAPWHPWKSCDYDFFLSGFWIVFHSCLLPYSQRLLDISPLAQVKCRLPKHPASLLAPFCFSIDPVIHISSFALSGE